MRYWLNKTATSGPVPNTLFHHSVATDIRHHRIYRRSIGWGSGWGFAREVARCGRLRFLVQSIALLLDRLPSPRRTTPEPPATGTATFLQIGHEWRPFALWLGTRLRQYLIDVEIDATCLSRMPLLSEEERNEVNSFFEDRHKVGSIQENHGSPRCRMLLHPVWRKSVDG